MLLSSDFVKQKDAIVLTDSCFKSEECVVIRIKNSVELLIILRNAAAVLSLIYLLYKFIRELICSINYKSRAKEELEARFLLA